MSFDGIEIGALWTGRGKALYTGKLGNARIVVLENQHKKSDNHPDARIFVVPDDKRDKGSTAAARDESDETGYPGGYGG